MVKKRKQGKWSKKENRDNGQKKKTGKMAKKKILSGKTGNLEILSKHRQNTEFC